MKNWTQMSGADFSTTGTQLGFDIPEGDGYGTGDLFALAAEVETPEPAAEFVERADGALFGIMPGIFGEADTIIEAA
jgi:hypothetical protein